MQLLWDPFASIFSLFNAPSSDKAANAARDVTMMLEAAGGSDKIKLPLRLQVGGCHRICA